MRIKLENTWLVGGGPEGLSSLTLNGEQIVDDAAFFRALARTFFARGAKQVTLQPVIARTFDTIREAEVFALTHFNNVPAQGRLECICGGAGDEQSVYLEGAVVLGVQPVQFGVRVEVRYEIKGGKFTTDVPEPLPSADPEEDEVSYRRGAAAIAEDAEQVDVTFSSPLASPPTTITPHVSHVTGDAAIDCELLQDTITDEGFSVKLSAPAPNGNYKLHYSAFL